MAAINIGGGGDNIVGAEAMFRLFDGGIKGTRAGDNGVGTTEAGTTGVDAVTHHSTTQTVTSPLNVRM